MLNFNIFINYLILETKFLLRNASERNNKGRQNESKVTKDKSAVARRCTKGNRAEIICIRRKRRRRK